MPSKEHFTFTVDNHTYDTGKISASDLVTAGGLAGKKLSKSKEFPPPPYLHLWFLDGSSVFVTDSVLISKLVKLV